MPAPVLSNNTSHSTNTPAMPKQRHALLHKLQVMGFTITLASCSGLVAVPMSAAAITTNTNSANTTTVDNNTTNKPNAEIEADPQVAPQPASPFNLNSAQNNATTDNALDNPNSLASNMHPSEQELLDANQELLSRNAKLQRDVNDLKTRVNVLINERSGQLFMYGAMTVIVSLLVGFVLSWFIFSRRERW